MSKIFVSMPAWEDTTLESTIHKLLSNADKPDNIVFGFGFNYENEPDISYLTNKYYILRDKEDYDIPNPGIIQIRNAIRRLMTDEDYYLSLDAHADFDPGWDTSLINDIEELHSISDRYVISKQLVQSELRNEHNYTKWSVNEFQVVSGRTEIDLSYEAVKDKFVNNKYYINNYLSCNFIFAKRNWCEEVNFPDYHGFPFEEQELSIVSFCHGFEAVSPRQDLCKIWAGNDPKYSFPYDEKWWKFIGTDRNNPSHWEKVWVFDDNEMIGHALELITLGKNKYYSLEGLPRTIKQFYDTIGV